MTWRPGILNNLPTAATTVPVTDSGSGSVGVSVLYARADHQHPVDVTRLAGTNNLSDLANVATARTNLGLAVVAASGSYSDLTNKPSIPVAGAALPTMNGAASAGTATTWSATDHVHPSDTSRAPLASPAFTGTPTGPTAAAGTNSTQLATTAFTQALVYGAIPAAAGLLLGGSGTPGSATSVSLGPGLQVSNGSLAVSAPRVITSSANATVQATDGLIVFNRTASPAALTLTLEASPVAGVQHRIKDMAGNAGSYPITVVAAGSGTIDGQTSGIVLNASYGAIAVEFNGLEWSLV